nr:MAG TPA: hypothetical protein [Bacteriophage sp.]
MHLCQCENNTCNHVPRARVSCSKYLSFFYAQIIHNKDICRSFALLKQTYTAVFSRVL